MWSDQPPDSCFGRKKLVGLVVVVVYLLTRYFLPTFLPSPAIHPIPPANRLFRSSFLTSRFLPTSFPLPTSHFPLPTSFLLPSHFLPTSFPLPSRFLPTSFPLHQRTRSVRGCILAVVERTEEEYNKVLQSLDAHSTEYVDRLKDEPRVCKIIIRTQVGWD